MEGTAKSNASPGVPSLPPRPLDGHKGLFGRVLIVGGSSAMIGAPVLAGTAAMRLGSGLVQLAVPRSIVGYCLTITPEVTALALGQGGDLALLQEAGARADAIAIGPGMGQSSDAADRLKCLTKLAGKKVVIDADGLNLLSLKKRWPAWFKARAVLTPHPGEMARLAKLLDRPSDIPSDEAGRLDLATAAAIAFGQVVLLKGHRTIVTDGRRAYVNQTGNSALSKGGSGDILTGMIVSLLGQGMEPYEAAVLGAHLHGRAGEIAGEKLGLRCVLGRDVIEAIPQTVAEHEARGVSGPN